MTNLFSDEGCSNEFSDLIDCVTSVDGEVLSAGMSASSRNLRLASGSKAGATVSYIWYCILGL